MFDRNLFYIFIGLKLYNLTLQVSDFGFDLGLDVRTGQVCKCHNVQILDACQKLITFSRLSLR
jgi:hypothetical protein